MADNETMTATVLVVDDNPTNLRVLLDTLRDAGIKLLVARSGEGALQQIPFGRPDVILLDVMMPGIDGFETCRRLKAQAEFKDIPVIFMTALTDTVDKLKGFEAGGVDYITKPLQHDEVLARVRTHLTIRRLQQQLEAKNRQLEELNVSKDKFFSIIAHDLRSPLGALLALIRLTAEQFDAYSHAEAQGIIEDIRTDSEHLYKLLENLLTWSRMQRGLMTYQPQAVDLTAMIAQNVQLFAAATAQKRITMATTAPSELIVSADANMLDTIIRNLISNALKFTGLDGVITISAGQQAPGVEVAVSDTGRGMSAAKLAELFRLDARHTDVGTAGEKGTGLGLKLCKDLVEQHRGRIWVESTVGQGTTVHFTLPGKE